MTHRVSFDLQFTPDGISTIVHGRMHPSGQQIEFCVPTGPEEEMVEAAKTALVEAIKRCCPTAGSVRITDGGTIKRGPTGFEVEDLCDLDD